MSDEYKFVNSLDDPDWVIEPEPDDNRPTAAIIATIILLVFWLVSAIVKHVRKDSSMPIIGGVFMWQAQPHYEPPQQGKI